jgi:hypothetical protein
MCVTARLFFYTKYTCTSCFLANYVAAVVCFCCFSVSSPQRQALAVGVPVVTLPGSHLGGRLTLALYYALGLPSNATIRKLDSQVDCRRERERERRGGGEGAGWVQGE